MTKEALARFKNEDYINFESYRKNGAPVATPLWFAEQDGVLYVYTLASAYKVKRVRNNPRVRVVPSTMSGKPKGEWVEATARVVGPDEEARGHSLLNKKYGWKKRLGDLFSKLRKRERVVMAIEFK